MAENPNSPPESVGPPWIFGHRGAPLETPENTLVSFGRALEQGLDGMAYEARVAAGFEVVVHADATLERTTSGTGSVSEATLAKLATLDAGGTFDARFQGERVPLLEEVLALAGTRVELGSPQHLILAPDSQDLERIRDVARGFVGRLSIRIASRFSETSRTISPFWRSCSVTAVFDSASTSPREGVPATSIADPPRSGPRSASGSMPMRRTSSSGRRAPRSTRSPPTSPRGR